MGRLILYHGSNNDFEQFDGDKIERQPGFWFSEDKDYASSHGKILYEVAIDDVRILDVDTEQGEKIIWTDFPNECNLESCEDNLYTEAFAHYLWQHGYEGFCFSRTEGRTYVITTRYADSYITILSKTKNNM